MDEEVKEEQKSLVILPQKNFQNELVQIFGVESEPKPAVVTMFDYAKPCSTVAASSIAKLIVNASNFEIKPNVI